jgi:hypothetical protein
MTRRFNDFRHCIHGGLVAGRNCFRYLSGLATYRASVHISFRLVGMYACEPRQKVSSHVDIDLIICRTG